MQHADIQCLGVCEMSHTGDERSLERPLIGPCGKGSRDIRLVDGRLAMSIFRHGHTLPRHPRVKAPQDEIEDTIIPQGALRTALGHREAREDTCMELRVGKLEGNRRRCRLCGRGAHQAMASREQY
jgi:hypothetical protein